MKFSVFVYVGNGRQPRRAQLLSTCESLELAVMLAKCVRLTFECPAWVADYFLPADLHNITRRAWYDSERNRVSA